MIAKFGSEEKFLAHMRKIAGQPHRRGFDDKKVATKAAKRKRRANKQKP